jgi:serine/threonine protein phosphatase PrpC
MGSKNQFILERFNTGLIAAPGKRSNMEDSFLIIHDLNIHPRLPISIYAVLDGHGGEWCAIFVK